MKRWVKGMRDAFFESLYQQARTNKNIILVTADTGAVCHDKFKKHLRSQYINVGIAEQNMVGIAAGLAMAGKIVYIYAIIPFVTMRCYEQIRVDLCCMGLPVTIVGIGAGFDYSTLGPTHHGTEDLALMRALPAMTIYSPADSIMADLFVKLSLTQKGPLYIRLDRTGFPLVYKKRLNKEKINIDQGLSVLKRGKDICIISTGRMVYSALQIAKKLSTYSINAEVIDLFRIKPLPKKVLWDKIKNVKYVATIEEHFITGGIGTAIAEMIAVKKQSPLLKFFGIPNRFCRRYGTREDLYNINRISIEDIVRAIKKWIRK